MFKIVKTATLSICIALGALASAPISAQAQNSSFYFGFGIQGPQTDFYSDDNGRRDMRGRNRHGMREYRGCTVREALHKARRMGLRQLRVASVNRRVIRIAGRGHDRHREMIVFANARACPILR